MCIRDSLYFWPTFFVHSDKRVSWHTMHKMLGRSTIKQPPKLRVWKFLEAWHFLSLPPLGDDTPHFLPVHIIGLSTLTKAVFILRVLLSIWLKNFKVSICWRYGLGQSPNLGVGEEANILANIWKYLDGCMGHATWQRVCTMLTGKVLSAWALLNKITYMHTCIIPCKPTPITLSVLCLLFCLRQCMTVPVEKFPYLHDIRQLRFVVQMNCEYGHSF